MSWFQILKEPYGLFPSDDSLLFADIMSSSNLSELLENIENKVFSDKKLNTLRNSLDQLKNNDEKIKQEMYKFRNMPSANQDFNQVKANIDKIIEILPKKSSPEKTKNIATLVSEIQEAEFKQKKALVDKLIELMPKRKSDWRRYPEARKLIEYQSYINARKSKNVLVFDTIPESPDTELLRFAELLNSEYKNGTIEINQKNISEFVKLINPIIYDGSNENDWEVKRIQNPKNKKEIINIFNESKKDSIEGKKELKKLYNMLKEKYSIKPVFSGKSTTVESSSDLGSKIAYLGTKYRISNAHTTFTADSVKKYIKAYEKITGQPKQLIPSWVHGKNPQNSDYNASTIGRNPTGSILPFPDKLFLERASENMKKLVLNPYGSAILYHSIGKNWFNIYMKMARQTEFISDERAENMIVNDIFDSISGVHGSNLSNSFRYNVPLEPYTTTIKGRSIDFNDSTYAKKKIRESINTIRARKTEVNNVTSRLRRDTVANLDNGWTKAEALAFLEFWKNSGYEGTEGKVTPIWYASPASNIELIEEDFGDRSKMIEAAEFARIEISWAIEGTEKYNDDYSEIISADFSAKQKFTPTETIERLGENFERRKKQRKQNYDKVIETKRKQNDKLREMLNGDISSSRRKEIKNTIAQREANIGRFEEVDSDAQQKTKLAINSIRKVSANIEDFPQFIIDLSEERKEKGGLGSLVDEVKNDFSKLAVLNAETAVGFLSYLSQFYPESKGFIQTAYESIDNRPEDAVSIAKDLNEDIPKFLNRMKELIKKSFENQLTHFVAHMFSYDKTKIAEIVSVFEKEELIEEV